jgi:uncharacterized membrane protein YdbT with pleckstrin-like domain
LSELSEHLKKDEKLIWSGKPAKAPFLVGGLVVSAFGLLWLSFSIFAMSMAVSSGDPGFATLFLLFFVLIGFGLTLGPPITQIFRYRNTKYVITDQRLITQTGAIGLDTRFIELDKIQEVHVNVSFIDKVFGTGTLIVVTAGFVFRGLTYPAIVALREPYAVQKLLQGAMLTDAHSPSL